ncbi:MAG: hypothetical protein H8D97_00200 [Proteobacteria bacterium]|nr:hypothetical protein [Pseudomonadota bacterium]
MIKMGIEGKFKDVGYYNTIDNPILPSEGLYLIPNEIYTYRMIYDVRIAKLLFFYTGTNIVAYYDYPGKVPITSIQISAAQKKELIEKFENCKIYGKDLKKTIEFLNGDKIGPFEDAILFPSNDIHYSEQEDTSDNPHMISNNKLQFKNGNTNEYIILKALQFQTVDKIEEIANSYIEKFLDNRLQFYREKRVNEYNEKIKQKN